MNLESFERYHKKLFALPKLSTLILLTILVSMVAAAEAVIFSTHPSFIAAIQISLTWIAATLGYSALAYMTLREGGLLTFKRVVGIAITGEVFSLILYPVIAALLAVLGKLNTLTYASLYDFALPASTIAAFFLLRSFTEHSQARVLALAAALPVILYLPSVMLWLDSLRIYKFFGILTLVTCLSLVGGARLGGICKKLVQVDTFKLMRSFLKVWFFERVEDLEHMFSLNAEKRLFEIHCILFKAAGGAGRWGLVAADIHPGPFDSVGSSRLPEQIWELGRKLGFKGLLFLKKPCTHAEDLASQTQVQRFLDAVRACLEETAPSERPAKATAALAVRSGEITVTGLELERRTILLVSRSPVPTEDFPRSIIQELRTQLPSLADVILVDAHNCMDQEYQELSSEDYNNLKQAVEAVVDQLNHSERYQLKAGFSSVDIPTARENGEIGEAGLSILLLEAGNEKFALVAFDSNNLRRGLREQILEELSRRGIRAEVVTTDTHAYTGIYRGVSYNPLGVHTPPSDILEAVKRALSEALETLEPVQVSIQSRAVELDAVGEEAFQRLQEGMNKSVKSIIQWFLLAAVVTITAATALVLL